MVETKGNALVNLTRACLDCCGRITLDPESNLLKCSLGREMGHPWSPPPGGCVIPKLYRRVENDKLAFETVTPEYVEEQRPKHDGNGNWLKVEKPKAAEPEPEPEPEEKA